MYKQACFFYFWYAQSTVHWMVNIVAVSSESKFYENPDINKSIIIIFWDIENMELCLSMHESLKL